MPTLFLGEAPRVLIEDANYRIRNAIERTFGFCVSDNQQIEYWHFSLSTIIQYALLSKPLENGQALDGLLGPGFVAEIDESSPGLPITIDEGEYASKFRKIASACETLLSVLEVPPPPALRPINLMRSSPADVVANNDRTLKTLIVAQIFGHLPGAERDVFDDRYMSVHRDKIAGETFDFLTVLKKATETCLENLQDHDLEVEEGGFMRVSRRGPRELHWVVSYRILLESICEAHGEKPVIWEDKGNSEEQYRGCVFLLAKNLQETLPRFLRTNDMTLFQRLERAGSTSKKRLPPNNSDSSGN